MKSAKKKHRRTLEDDVREGLRLEHKRFIKKFGREPTDDDPLFWDENADIPTPMSGETLRQGALKAMRDARIDPLLIYLFEKTGRIITEETYKYLSPEDRAEYDAAADEYYAMELAAEANPQ